MEIVERYGSIEEAKIAIVASNKLGYRVLHEDHLYQDVVEFVDETSVVDGVESVKKVERKSRVLEAVAVTYDTAPDNTPLVEVDWKARFAAASTVAEKLAIVAERIGLR